MNEEIKNIIRTEGLFLEKEIFDFVNQLKQPSVAASFLQQLARASGQKFITRSILTKNYGVVFDAVRQLGDDQKQVFEQFFVTLGLQLEVRRESIVQVKPDKVAGDAEKPISYRLFYADTLPNKKIEVQDFVGYFRSRYQQIQKILMARPEIQTNLVSINKISSQRSNLNLIAFIKQKQITKNKNMFLTVEDLTGEIRVLVRHENHELYEKADELQLDDIVGIKAMGDKNFLTAQDFIFPDSFLHHKTFFTNDCSIAFLSDIHAGSTLHLKDKVERFLDWINSDDEDARKIRYIFFVGDNVDGVGIFPGQESMLQLKSMNEQYALLASYFRRIPKHITMFLIPGQHDASRVAEPQPIISKKYAPELYAIENLVLVTNPALITLCEGEKEFRVLLYHGANIHYLINEIKELREMKAHKCPAKAVKHMLKRRHLGPTHSEVVYVPNSQFDPLVISEVPDILATGEVHRMDIDYYNGTLIITGSCWQAQTPYEEKVGNIPDPCKVPVFNLKTRELKIFDFSGEEKNANNS